MAKIKPGLVVEVPATSFMLGRSDTGAKKLGYTTSPLYDGSYSSDETVRARYFSPPELNGTEMNDGGYAFGIVDRAYSDAPNLAEVEIGGGGKPGSPFAPNLGVPGEANGHNPAAIPDSGAQLTEALRSRSAGAFVGNGLVSPHSTSPTVASKEGKALGIGSANSFRIRIG